MLIAALPGHYAPVLTEGAFALFRRTSPLAPGVAAKALLLEQTVPLSKDIGLPRLGRHPLWLEVDAVPNLLGRLRAALYKPSTLELVTMDDLGQQNRWRLLPRVARSGFLLVPKLEHGSDVESFLAGRTEASVRAFHFEAPGSQGEFWDHFDVRVFELTDLPLRLVPNRLPVELGIFDRRALDVTSAEQLEIIDVPEGKALLLHAEGEVRFEVPSSVRRVVLSFGLRGGSFDAGGHTAGVDFSVSRLGAAGTSERLWHRFLDPVREAGDRGTQHIEVPIPPGGPATIAIHTAAGGGTDNRWDWSYVTGVRFDAAAKP